MGVTGRQKQYLRGLAHKRKPVVTIGNRGLSESVIVEIQEALEHHELLKIKLPALPHEERDGMLHAIAGATGAEVIQGIGRTGVIYLAADPARIELPV